MKRLLTTELFSVSFYHLDKAVPLHYTHNQLTTLVTTVLLLPVLSPHPFPFSSQKPLTHGLPVYVSSFPTFHSFHLFYTENLILHLSLSEKPNNIMPRISTERKRQRRKKKERERRGVVGERTIWPTVCMFNVRLYLPPVLHQYYSANYSS